MDDSTTIITPNVTIGNGEYETKIKYVYFLAGGFEIMHCIVFFILYLNGDRTCCIQKKDSDGEQAHDEDSLASYNKPFLISFVVLVFLFYWMYYVLKLTYATYLTT